MINKLFKTPLIAAFFYVTILAACSEGQSGSQAVVSQCPISTTAIASVQGNATVSPMQGQQVTVQGIVTLVQDDHGLYIEEPTSDADEHTSNAIFIQFADFPADVVQGSLISARGEVSEIGKGRYSLTALTGVDQLTQCAPGLALPLTDVTLPLNGPGREALEGMRIQIGDTLTVTDVYQFGRGK